MYARLPPILLTTTSPMPPLGIRAAPAPRKPAATKAGAQALFNIGLT